MTKSRESVQTASETTPEGSPTAAKKSEDPALRWQLTHDDPFDNLSDARAFREAECPRSVFRAMS